MKIQIIFVYVFLVLNYTVYGLDVPADICVGQTPAALLPHPDNCTQFIICMLPNFIIAYCPPQTPVFHNGTCGYGYPETCSFGTTAKRITTSDYTTTELDDATETTEDVIETTISPEFTTDISTNKPTTTSRFLTTTPVPVHRCPPGGFGYIPHYTNCNRYFECIKGIRHMRFCPDGLHFDSVTLQCTYPELAVCAGYH